MSGDVEIGSCTMITTSVPAVQAQPILSYGVTSLPLKPSINQLQTAAHGPGEFTRVIQKAPPPRQAKAFEPPAATYAPPTAMPVPGAPPKMEKSRPPAPITLGAPAPRSLPSRSRSSRAAWIGIGSAAAAIALVTAAITFNGTNTARPPAPSSVELPAPPPAEPVPQIMALNEAIKRQPKAPELYLQRAQQLQRAGQTNEALADAKHATELAPNNVQAHLLYAQLLEKANLTDQAIEQYEKVQALKPTPEVRAMAVQRVAALER
jgi:hypothetical protein